MTVDASESGESAIEALTLEGAICAEVERVEALLKGARKYCDVLKAWKKHAEGGNVAGLGKAAEQARKLAAEQAERVETAAAAWTFDASAWLSSGQWLDDTQQATDRLEVRTVRVDDMLIAPPVLVRALPGKLSLKIGRDVRGTLRPQTTAELLKRIRDQKLAGGAVEFLDRLYDVWKALRSVDRPVTRFCDIYTYFCMAPGWKRDNPEQAFAQQLLALHGSGLRATRKGVPFHIEYPSGNVKKRDVISVYADDGSVLRFYGIRFLESL